MAYVVPGDVLRLDNKRKATCFYLGILEMGQYLRFEEAWVPVGILLATEAKQLQGGFPAAARALLRSLLVGTDGIGTSGVSISVDGNSHIVYFRFCRLIGDEVATKTFFDSKGFVGLKCCMGCMNVVKLTRADGATRALDV